MRNCILLFGLIGLVFINTQAQYYTSGTAPFSTKWKQIKTERYKIIFNNDSKDQANRLASVLDTSMDALSETLKHKPGRISIVLYNQDINSNGFVTWAPKRSELYTSPIQNDLSMNYIDMLILHEYRHVVQTDKLFRGFTRFCFGEQSIGLQIIQTPFWLIEGDAVVTETALSSSGRGRQPEFAMLLKGLHEKNPFVTFDQSYMGSFKQYIPSHYNLGYHMVSYSRTKYGSEIWEKAFTNAARSFFLPSAINRSLKKHYNTNTSGIYSETFDSLNTYWKNEYEKETFNAFSTIPVSSSNNDFVNYRFISPISNSRFLSYKTSLNRIPRFVIISGSGKEKKLFEPDILTTMYLSVKDTLIAWDEPVPHIRREHKEYSVIKILNLQTNKICQLTHKSRYFSPSISDNKLKIAVIESGIDYKSSLVILNILNKNVEYIYTAPSGLTLYNPYWSSDSTVLFFTLSEKGKSISEFNIITQSVTGLMPPIYEIIDQLTCWDSFIIFRAGFNSVDNIYALNKKSKQIYRITTSKLGAYDPLVPSNADTLYYSEYTPEGYRPAFLKLDTSDWVSLSFSLSEDRIWINNISSQENFNLQKFEIPQLKYTINKYSELTHLFNPHSWIPFYSWDTKSDFTPDNLCLGFTLLSQNVLSTCISSFSYSYENKHHIFSPLISYRGFFPVFEFSANIGGIPQYINFVTDNILSSDYNKSFNVAAKLPLNFSGGKYNRFVQPEIALKYDNRYYLAPTDSSLNQGSGILNYSILLYSLIHQAHRNLYPRLGIFTFINFKKVILTSQSIFAEMFSFQSGIYLPGLFSNNSILLRGSFQKHLTNHHLVLSNDIALPRGYSEYMLLFKGKEFFKITGDYAFPILYPDFSLYSLLYLKRVRGKIFYDFAYGNVNEYYSKEIFIKTNNSYISTGFEIGFDYHLFRLPFLFGTSFRASYLPRIGKIYPEFTFELITPFL